MILFPRRQLFKMRTARLEARLSFDVNVQLMIMVENRHKVRLEKTNVLITQHMNRWPSHPEADDIQRCHRASLILTSLVKVPRYLVPIMTFHYYDGDRVIRQKLDDRINKNKRIKNMTIGLKIEKKTIIIYQIFYW